MDAPSPRYILTRTLFILAAIVAVLFAMSFVKKKQRQAAIIAELKSLSSDSSYFQQFYAADARKSLIRAVSLIAEINGLGVPPDVAMDQCLGLEKKFIEVEGDVDGPTPRQSIIRANLRGNYENFLKLGYQADYHTLKTMKEGTLPPIPSGPESGNTAVVVTIIDPSASPGMDKVMANLAIRPPQSEKSAASDVEIAAAKQLARDFSDAKIIEESVRDKILEKLSVPSAP